MSDAIVIVDANSFYCSCSAAFDASLARRPVIVLSNNDGNVIAWSREAKRLGVQMGVPYFEIRGLVARHNVAVFSSNHGFFADMSWRFQSLLYEYAPRVEHYSIDEAWLALEAMSERSRQTIVRDIHQRIFALSGIPVAVGIAETKTLAKVALEFAKTSAKTGGVLDLTRSPYQSTALERLPVAEVWGIGSRYAELLNRHDIASALDLREAEDDWIRRHLTIVGLRTVRELRGIVCHPINPQPPPLRADEALPDHGHEHSFDYVWHEAGSR
jgi:DNA polymerase V